MHNAICLPTFQDKRRLDSILKDTAWQKELYTIMYILPT